MVRRDRRKAAPSGAMGILHMLGFEKVLDGQGALQMQAGLANGRVHLLQRVVGDGGNFFRVKTLDCIEDEDLAVGTPGIAQRELHQGDQLATGRHLLRIAGVAVGDEVLFEKPLVRLMKLQPGFVTGQDILGAVAAVERDVDSVAIAGRHAVDGLAGQAVEPGLDLDALGLLQFIAQRGGDGFGHHIFGRDLIGKQFAQAFAIVDLALDETGSSRTTATVSSKGTVPAPLSSAPRRRTHLCLLRSTCLWRLSCSISASNAARIAAAAVALFSCVAICPEGKRRLSDTTKPSRAEFSSTMPLTCTSSGRNTCKCLLSFSS